MLNSSHKLGGEVISFMLGPASTSLRIAQGSLQQADHTQKRRKVRNNEPLYISGSDLSETLLPSGQESKYNASGPMMLFIVIRGRPLFKDLHSASGVSDSTEIYVCALPRHAAGRTLGERAHIDIESPLGKQDCCQKASWSCSHHNNFLALSIL